MAVEEWPGQDNSHWRLNQQAHVEFGPEDGLKFMTGIRGLLNEINDPDFEITAITTAHLLDPEGKCRSQSVMVADRFLATLTESGELAYSGPSRKCRDPIATYSIPLPTQPNFTLVDVSS